MATLDLLSGGRVLFGVGAGWNEEELENHGTDPRRRFGVMRERVEAMKAIWTQDEASYRRRARRRSSRCGRGRSRSQKPHPPVLVGGNGRKVLDRVLAYGDEWFPNGFRDEERFVDRLDQLRRGASEAERDPIPVTLQLAPTDPAALERLERAGVTRCVWYLPTAGEDEVERALDRYAQVVEAAR